MCAIATTMHPIPSALELGILLGRISHRDVEAAERLSWLINRTDLTPEEAAVTRHVTKGISSSNPRFLDDLEAVNLILDHCHPLPRPAVGINAQAA